MPKYSDEARRLFPYLLPLIQRASVRNLSGNGNGGGGGGGGTSAPISFFDLTDVDAAGWDNGEVPTWDVASGSFKPTLPAGGVGVTYVEGNGIDIAGTLISALAHPTRGIIVDSGGIGVKAHTDGGLLADVDGLYIHPKTHSGLVIDSAGVAVGAGDGILVSGTLTRVDASDLVGLGIEEDGSNNFKVKLATSEYPALTLDSTGLYVDLPTDSGLTKTSSGLALGVPSDLTYSTTNDISGSTHVHNILSSADVTAGASSLLHAAAGDLRLKTLDLAGDLTFVLGNRSIHASDALTLIPDDDLVINPGGVVNYANSQESRTGTFNDFVAGITGFRLWDPTYVDPGPGANTMQLTIGGIKADELYVRKFTADEARVNRGEEFWARSFGIVQEAFTLPADEATVDVWFEEAPGLGSAKLFLPNNWLLLRTIDWSVGLEVYRIWFQVVDADSTGLDDWVAREEKTATVPSRQKWRLRRKFSLLATSSVIKPGEVIVDFGRPNSAVPPGQGVVHLSALAQDGGPFVQIETFDHVTSDVPQFKNRVRMGNLTGTVDFSTIAWGFAAGDDLSVTPVDGFSGVAIDQDQGTRLFNTDLVLYDDNIQMLHLTRSSGIAMRNETLAFNDPLRFIAWYDDLDEQEDVPRTMIGASQVISGGQVTRSLLLHQNTNEDGSDAEVRIEAWEGATGPQAALLLNSREDLWGGTEGTVFEAFADETHVQKLVVSPAGGHVTTNALLHIGESSSNVNFNAGATIEQQGAGDAVLHWHLHQMSGSTVTTNVWYSAGIDNDSGNVWKLSANHTLGGATDFFIYNPSTGAVSIPGFDYGTSPAPVDIAAGDGISIAGTTISVNSTIARSGIQIIAGDGLAGGGDLTANRTLAVLTPGGGGLSVGPSGVIINDTLAGAGLDMSLAKVMSLSNSVAGLGLSINSTTKVIDVDSTIARSAVEIFAGDGLEGGGLLTGDVTLDVDSSVARSTTQILAGFGIDVVGGTLSADSTISVDSDIARSATLMSAGLGILGGGTLAANRSFAIDPTYVVRTTTQVIAGDGLTGGGALLGTVTLDVGAGDGITVLANAVAVDKADAFDWTGAHTWDESITISGGIFFIGADRQITTEGSDILYLRPGGNLEMEAGNNILLEPAGYVQVRNGAEVRSTTQADAISGITGHRLWWPSASTAQLTITGLKSDSMYTRFFTADEVRINRGEEFWSKSYGIVEEDFVLPATFNNVTVYIEDVPTITGQVFAVGDKIQARVIDWATGLTATTIWFQVTSFLGLDAGNRRQSYRLNLNAGGSLGMTIHKGSVLVDFGTVAQGMIHLNALRDGGGPWLQFSRMATAGITPTFNHYVRVGQLNGTVDYTSDAWGLVAGNNIGSAPASFRGFTADNVQGLRLFNTDILMYEGGVATMKLDDQEGIRIARGTGAPNTLAWVADPSAPGSTVYTSQYSYDSGTYDLLVQRAFGANTSRNGTIHLQTYRGLATTDPYMGLWLNYNGMIVGTTFTSPPTGKVMEVERGGNVGIGSGSAGILSHLHIYESNAEVGVAAGMLIEQGGSGDAKINLRKTTSGTVNQHWSLGIDQSNSNRFGIAPFANLSVNPGITLTQDSWLGLGTQLPGEGMAGGAYVYPTSYSLLHIVGSSAALTVEASSGVAELDLIDRGSATNSRWWNIYNSNLVTTIRARNADGSDKYDMQRFSLASGAVTFPTAVDFTLAANFVSGLGVNNAAPSTWLQIGSGTTINTNPGVWVSTADTNVAFVAHAVGGQEAAFQAHSNGNIYFGSWSNHPVQIRTNNTDKMTILANGDVGINDTSPTFKLDVNGTLRAVGLMSANAGINFGQADLTYFNESTSFAPVITFGATPVTSYTLQVGRYTRIGSMVIYSFTVSVNVRGAGTGAMTITLPFAAAANAGFNGSFYFEGLSGGAVSFVGQAVSNKLEIRYMAAGGSSYAPFTGASVTTGFLLSGVAIYQV